MGDELDVIGALTWARDEAERAETRAIKDRKSGNGEPWATYARVFRGFLYWAAAPQEQEER